MRAYEFITESETYQPPEIETGDEIKIGKFKNRKAIVKGFNTDKHNQPVLQTNKGDVQLFKPRITKLMTDDVTTVESMNKPGVQADHMPKLSKFALEWYENPSDDVSYSEDPCGYYVTVNDKRIEPFYPAEAPWKRNAAYEAAKKHMVKLRSEEHSADFNRREAEYQARPLSAIEQEWADLTNRYMSLSEKEFARWNQLTDSRGIRSSLLNRTHPAITLLSMRNRE